MQFADVVRFERFSLEILQDGDEVFIRDKDFGIGVLGHKFQALLRIGGVQRKVGAAGFEHAQRGEHHIFVAPQHNAHHALGRDAALDVGGQVVCQFVHLAVGQARVFIHDRGVVRMRFHLPAESVQNGVARILLHNCLSM